MSGQALAAISPAARHERRRLRPRTQTSFVRPNPIHENLVITKVLCRAADVYKARQNGMPRTGGHRAIIKTSSAPNPLSPGPHRDRQESRQGRRRRRRGTGPQSKGKEPQRDLHQRVEDCSAPGVPGTSNEKPSESMLKNTGGLPVLGFVPASSRVGRPPVLRLVARAGCPHNFLQGSSPYHIIAPSAHSAGCGSSPTHGRCLPHALKDTQKATLQQYVVEGS